MTDLAIGLSAADAAELAAVADEVARADAAVNAAQAWRTRAFARAEGIAARMAAGSSASVRERDMTRRAVAAEIAVPLLVSDRTVQKQMNDAAMLVTDYPATLNAWEMNRISHGHVRVIVDVGTHLPSEVRGAFEARALAVCERSTPGRAKETVTLHAERLHPRSATERHRDGREDRRVWVGVLGDGMSRVTADVPTILGEGIHDRLTRITTTIVDTRTQAKTRVRDARAAGVAEHELDPIDCATAADTRTVEQIRVDILCDLLLTGSPDADPTIDADGTGELGAIRAHVQVVITATTLLSTDEHPADLAGAGPIDAATARELAGNANGFDRILTHPITGQVLATDRYTPTPDLRRRLRARDRYCRFPGCRVPALRCEHDHTIDHHLGGKTTLENLAGLCQRHHSVKQFTPWRVRQRGDGVLEWTSPAGRTYTDEPPTPLVCFTPDDSTAPPF